MKEEMSLDLDRIWHRNMGRDDRVISVNGKEARFPFLDVAIQEFLRQNLADCEEAENGELKSYLYDTTEKRGMGDKRLLREIAKEGLGL